MSKRRKVWENVSPKVISWKMAYKEYHTNKLYVLHNLIPHYICPRKDYDHIGLILDTKQAYKTEYLYNSPFKEISFIPSKCKICHIALLSSKSPGCQQRIFGDKKTDISFISKSKIIRNITPTYDKNVVNTFSNILQDMIPPDLEYCHEYNHRKRFYSLQVENYYTRECILIMIINCNSLDYNIYECRFLEKQYVSNLLDTAVNIGCRKCK